MKIRFLRCSILEKMKFNMTHNLNSKLYSLSSKIQLLSKTRNLKSRILKIKNLIFNFKSLKFEYLALKNLFNLRVNKFFSIFNDNKFFKYESKQNLNLWVLFENSHVFDTMFHPFRY